MVIQFKKTAGLAALGAVLILSACDNPQQLATLLQPSTEPQETTVTVIEQEVEAPEVFHTAEDALDEVLAGSAAPEFRPTEEPITIVSSTETTVATTQVSSLEKPYIQLGIFGVETNASNTATAMRLDGISTTIKEYEANGKTFWRVLVGPAANASERRAFLNKVREKGFTDAYFVSR